MKNIATLSTSTPSFEDRLVAILTSIDNRLEQIEERLETIEVRLSDMDLNSGDGFEREDY